MARRFYFPSTGAAAVSPTFGGGASPGWGTTTGADRLEAVTTKISSSMTNKASDGTINNQGLSPLVRQYVSKPIGAQTITGTIKGQARALESSTSNNQMARLLVYVVSGDGATVRGILYNGADTQQGSNPASEFNTALRNAKFPWASETPWNLTSVTAQNGDRIVFEWGANKENFSATGRTVTINFGDNSGTDLAEDETTTTANNPWVEFSQTITDASSGTTYTKAGSIVSDASVAGADVATRVETGAIVSAASLLGPDVSEHSETGAIVSAAAVAGADVATRVETGAIIAAGVLSGVHPLGIEYAKTGKMIVGEDIALLAASGAVDDVVANGIVVDLDPPSGIDNVKEIRIDPTAPTYSAGLTVALPQGDSGAVLTTPTGDMTDTIWDQFSANDDGFYSSVKNTAGNRWFSTNVRIGGMSGTVEPNLAPYDPADHGWVDGDNLWSDTSRRLINQDDGWQANTVYLQNDCIVENGRVWRATAGGGTSNNVGFKPTFPGLTGGGAANNTVSGDGDAAHGGSGDFLWSQLGEYLGVWAPSTNFIPGIYNNSGGRPIYMMTGYATTPTHPDKMIILVAHTGGTLAVTTTEPSWNAASNSRELYRDGNGIVWIAGGNSLFGTDPTTHGGEKCVVTTLKAPATNKIIKLTNSGAAGTQVVLADHRNMTDYWGAQGYNVNGVWVGNQALPFGDRFVRNPTDVDGTAANRFQFTASGTRKSERYIFGGKSIYLIYNTTTGFWSEYVPSGASLSGSKAISLNKKAIVVATGVLSGSNKPENLKSGSIVAAGVLAGDQVQSVSKTGAVISPAAVSGADVSTRVETGSIIAAGSLAGSRIRDRLRTGAIVSAAAVAGADVAEHSETGALVSAAAVAGADVAQHVETGALIAAGVLAGADAHDAIRAGSVVSAAALAGGDATTHAETGTITSPASVAGADVYQAVESGAVVSAAVLAGTAVKQQQGKSGSVVSAAAVSGADVAAYTETGSIKSDAKVSAADVAEHPETGSIKSDAIVSGAGDAVRNKTGAIISSAQMSASDVAEHSEAGAIVSAAVLSGADQTTHVETGTLVSAAVLAGSDAVIVSRQGSLVAAAKVAASDIYIATRSGTIAATAVIGASDQVTYVEIGSIVSAAALTGVGFNQTGKTGSIVSTVILSGVSFHYVPPTAPAGTRKVIIRAREGAILLSAGEDATLTSAEEEAHGLGSASFYSS